MFVILHGIFYSSRTLHHAFDETRTATKQVMVLGNSPKIFVLARSCVTMNATVNQDDTIDDILSCIVNHKRLIIGQIQ